ncbi:MAG TPA: diguanylate cyclase [Acidimicrobiales bacterium]|nr:diguanylate cyclase [Acidimicrobiales bacterium]
MTPTEDAGATERALDALRSAGTNPVVQGFPEGAIVVFDKELRYLCAGGQGLSIVGLTKEMIEGKTIFEVFPPEVSSVLEQPYRRALEGHEVSLDVEFGGRTFSHRIAPLAVSDNPIVAGIGFALEVTEVRRAELALRTSETDLIEQRRRLHDAELIGHSGSWEWDIAHDVITWSEGLFALHGLERMNFNEGYPQAASRVHADDRAIVDEAMESCRRNEPVQFRYRVHRASDGEIRWFDSRAHGVFENGALVRLVGAVADVTEQILAEARVIEANNFMNAVLIASPDYTFITNVRTGAMVFGSRERDLLGRASSTSESMGTRAIETIVHPDDHETLLAMNDEATRLEDGQVLEMRYRLRHADGQWHWMSRHVVPFRRDDTGSVIEVLGVLRDITDVVNAEEQLIHGALHDPLTGLPNRSLLLDRLEAALVRSSRDDSEIAILYCDLDGFKEVNDSAGHAAGDAVLIEVARRLLGAVREGDTVARVGGDEFVVVVEPWNRVGVGGETAAETSTIQGRDFSLEVANRVVQAIAQPFVVNGVDFVVTVSIGLAHPSTKGISGSGSVRAAQGLANADAAMYTAKKNGKNRIELFVSDSSEV